MTVGDDRPASDPRRAILEIFQDALRAVDGCAAVHEYLVRHSITTSVHVIAIGKAACAMARGADLALGAGILDALIITKEGHAESLPWPVLEAGHPVPDARSLKAGHALLVFARALPVEARVLVLLSGGASALVECLPPEVDLDRLQCINRWLLASGLDIGDMNRIRKRLSLIKGGRLAQALAPRAVTCLAVSDVPGDDPRAIGSGPLVADAALQAPLAAELPDFLRAALAATVPAPALGDACFDRVEFEIVARLDDAKRAAVHAAERRGYRAQSMPEFIAGDAAEAGTRLAQQLLQAPPGVIHVWGGETTVRLPPQPGRGGRNQHTALAAALELSGTDGVYFLAAGTDGTDGPTPDAGALVDGGTIARGKMHGFDARAVLTRADTGTFLEASGDLIHTGPTGTNVMDLMIGLRTER